MASAAAAAAIAFSVLCRPSSFSWSLRNSGSSPAKITPPRMLTSQSGSAAISVVGQKRTQPCAAAEVAAPQLRVAAL